MLITLVKNLNMVCTNDILWQAILGECLLIVYFYMFICMCNFSVCDMFCIISVLQVPLTIIRKLTSLKHSTMQFALN